MCTAVSMGGKRHLFGRTLDAEASYGEKVVIAPRNFEFSFRHLPPNESHPAIIGTACVVGEVPLYFDAVNEYGLGMAGLNFRKNAKYHSPLPNMHNVASFELIPWILCRCKNITEAKELLTRTNVTDDSFSGNLPTTPLHFIISDKIGCVTVESTKGGLKIYDNPFGVLTNNPPFPYHAENVKNYMFLSPAAPQNNLCKNAKLTPFSFGMGAIGLPGDFSSPSRFIRAVFAKNNVDAGESSVNAFFHVMDTISVPKGCVYTEDGRAHYTLYTSCTDADTGTYYYTTYENRSISSVSMKNASLDSDKLAVYYM